MKVFGVVIVAGTGAVIAWISWLYGQSTLIIVLSGLISAGVMWAFWSMLKSEVRKRCPEVFPK